MYLLWVVFIAPCSSVIIELVIKCLVILELNVKLEFWPFCKVFSVFSFDKLFLKFNRMILIEYLFKISNISSTEFHDEIRWHPVQLKKTKPIIVALVTGYTTDFPRTVPADWSSWARGGRYDLCLTVYPREEAKSWLSFGLKLWLWRMPLGWYLDFHSNFDGHLKVIFSSRIYFFICLLGWQKTKHI